MCEEGLHDPFTDQVECARYRAERDALAQRMEEVASEIDRMLSGVEGIEDAPAMRWMRGLREALGALHAPRIGYEDIEAARWVRGHGGLEHVKDICHDLRAVVERLGIEWSESELHGLMDVLDRRLMTEGMEEIIARYPRYEDGTPALPGMEAVANSGSKSGETFTIRKAWLENGTWHLSDHVADGHYWHWKHKDRVVKRPAKVLDADGAEIRVGDTVWSILLDEPHEWTVIEPDDGAHRVIVRINCGIKAFAKPENLTHRAPVIAADGRPLREGETVWVVNDPHEELRIIGFCKDGDVRLANRANDILYRASDVLTHERPDSWERLEEDADGIVHDIAWNIGDYSPSDFKVPGDSLQDRVVDLVRRAEALSERGQ